MTVFVITYLVENEVISVSSTKERAEREALEFIASELSLSADQEEFNYILSEEISIDEFEVLE